MLGLYNMWQVLVGCFYKKSTYRQVRNYSNFFYYKQRTVLLNRVSQYSPD